MEDKGQCRRQMLLDAANHLQSAIDLLDGAAAPGQIAAHVDLALHRLNTVATRTDPADQQDVDILGEGYREAQASSLQR